MERGTRQLDLFGDHLLLSEAKTREKRAAGMITEAERRKDTFPISLSERERRMIEKLG